MLHDILARTYREIEEHLTDHPATYGPHTPMLRELQASIAVVMMTVSRRPADKPAVKTAWRVHIRGTDPRNASLHDSRDAAEKWVRRMRAEGVTHVKFTIERVTLTAST